MMQWLRENLPEWEHIAVGKAGNVCESRKNVKTKSGEEVMVVSCVTLSFDNLRLYRNPKQPRTFMSMEQFAAYEAAGGYVQDGMVEEIAYRSGSSIKAWSEAYDLFPSATVDGLKADLKKMIPLAFAK